MKKLSITQAKPTDDLLSYNFRAVSFIKKIVAHYYHLPLEVFDNTTRNREIINAKHTAIYFCRTNLKVTTNWLGKQFNVDHATTIHVKKKFDNLLSWDKILMREFDDIQNIISFKGLAEAKGVDLHKEYYYIDLNNIVSVKLEPSKAIIFSGWTEDEIKKLMKELYLNGSGEIQEPPETKKHRNTGLYIMERKKKEPINKSNTNKNEKS